MSKKTDSIVFELNTKLKKDFLTKVVADACKFSPEYQRYIETKK